MYKNIVQFLLVFMFSSILLACSEPPREQPQEPVMPTLAAVADVPDVEAATATETAVTDTPQPTDTAQAEEPIPTESPAINTPEPIDSPPTATPQPVALLPTFTPEPTIQLPFIIKGQGQDACYLDTALRQQLESRARLSTLDGVFNNTQLQQISLAYFDPAAALANMGNISWAVPNIPAPFVGHLPMPGQHGNAAINDYQFRHAFDVAIPKPTNVYRIFLVGGSTAYGSGAPSQESTIAGYLSQLLADNLTPVTGLAYEVINAANPAWASTHERIFIENRLSELEPDLVISFSGNNDVHWGDAGRNVLWFRSYDDDIFLALVDSAYNIIGYPDIPEITEIEDQPIPPALVAERLLKNVVLSDFVLALDNVQYAFVLQPTLPVTDKILTAREAAALNQSLVPYFRESYQLMDTGLSNITADNFTYINLAPVFDDAPPDEEIFLDPYHFGDRGYSYIANAIYSQIVDLLIP